VGYSITVKLTADEAIRYLRLNTSGQPQLVRCKNRIGLEPMLQELLQDRLVL
jgi:hypothetical protein